MTNKLEYTRGSIWWANLQGFNQSSVQRGYRPVIIVSSLAGCLSSDLVMVCPITTKKKYHSVNVEIPPITEGGLECLVLTNQITTLPKNMLSRPSGFVSPENMAKIEEGLLISLGIAKSVCNQVKSTHDDLIKAKEDREQLEKLLPQAKEILGELSALVNRVDIRKKKKGFSYKSVYSDRISKKTVRRSQEEIKDFIHEWEDKGNDKTEVFQAYGFNTYSAAYQFYQYHKKKVKNG